MKHAREDYNRIQDPAELIPDDEPVFLIRGQDDFGAETVEDYADKLLRKRVELEELFNLEVNEAFLSPEEIKQKGEEIADLLDMELMSRQQASRMRLWPTKKVPDIRPKKPDFNEPQREHFAD